MRLFSTVRGLSSLVQQDVNRRNHVVFPQRGPEPTVRKITVAWQSGAETPHPENPSDGESLKTRAEHLTSDRATRNGSDPSHSHQARNRASEPARRAARFLRFSPVNGFQCDRHGQRRRAARVHVETVSMEAVRHAIVGAQNYLLDRQEPEGYWVAELEGDTILESEYILLLQFLDKRDPEKFRKLANYIRSKQDPKEGHWAIYPGGPPDVSASVKAYFACKLAGHKETEPFMKRARKAILNQGGVTQCNTFTKLYLSMFGQYDWRGVPTIPPEAILMPKWFYFNIYNMSSWSRAILVPLAVMNASKPQRPIPDDAHIHELFVGGRDRKKMGLTWDRKPLTWRNVFLVLDKILKLYDASPVKPFRKRALKKSLAWLLEREENSGGLGAIFPAMTHAIMAYKCMGLEDNHKAIRKELAELAAFEIEGEVNGAECIRMQPCVSPIWDTALVINSLVDSGYDADSEAVQKAADWLLSKQTTRKGDWAVKVPRCGTGRVVLRDGKRILPGRGRHDHGADGTVQSLLSERRVLGGSGPARPREYAQGHRVGVCDAEPRRRLGQLRQRQRQDAAAIRAVCRPQRHARPVQRGHHGPDIGDVQLLQHRQKRIPNGAGAYKRR